MKNISYYSYTNKYRTCHGNKVLLTEGGPLNYTGLNPTAFPPPDNYYFQLWKLKRESPQYQQDLQQRTNYIQNFQCTNLN